MLLCSLWCFLWDDRSGFPPYTLVSSSSGSLETGCVLWCYLAPLLDGILWRTRNLAWLAHSAHWSRPRALFPLAGSLLSNCSTLPRPLTSLPCFPSAYSFSLISPFSTSRRYRFRLHTHQSISHLPSSDFLTLSSIASLQGEFPGGGWTSRLSGVCPGADLFVVLGISTSGGIDHRQGNQHAP
ncbi:hypothetical protein C8Q79DRAFT_660593 [Trametes meyenii]|nr:hypothetical protein C8Q79DRAFT_660593 [Trametes meyenii]